MVLQQFLPDLLSITSPEEGVMPLAPIPTARPALFIDAETMENDLRRDAPDDEFMEQVRAAYPTEREYDRMLTRKMERRREPGTHRQITLGEMTDHVTRFLDAHVDGPFTVTDTRWMLGGASKIQFGFTLLRPEAPEEERSARLVIRMEPRESLNATSRARERQLLDAMSHTVPVPRTRWVDTDGTWFP